MSTKCLLVVNLYYSRLAHYYRYYYRYKLTDTAIYHNSRYSGFPELQTHVIKLMIQFNLFYYIIRTLHKWIVHFLTESFI